MPKSPAHARAFEETARPGHRLIDPSASAAIRKGSSQTVESSLQLLADSPVQVGQVLDSGSLLRTGARDGTLRLPVVDKDFHVREHERELTREYSVQEDVCTRGSNVSEGYITPWRARGGARWKCVAKTVLGCSISRRLVNEPGINAIKVVVQLTACKPSLSKYSTTPQNKPAPSSGSVPLPNSSTISKEREVQFRSAKL